MNSSELKGYLTGLIIGDGRIDHGVTKRAFEIKSINKEFIDKIKSDLDSCNTFDTYCRYIKGYTDKHGVIHRDCWLLRVSAHPYFAKKYHHFYRDDRSRWCSAESLRWMTPNGLANWYMSSGNVYLLGKKSNKIYNRKIEILCKYYNFETVNRLKSMMKDEFHLAVSVVKRGRVYRLRILSQSYADFINLIKEYIVPSMMYKLYLGYEKQPVWMPDDMWAFQEDLRSAIAPTALAAG